MTSLVITPVADGYTVGNTTFATDFVNALGGVGALQNLVNVMNKSPFMVSLLNNSGGYITLDGSNMTGTGSSSYVNGTFFDPNTVATATDDQIAVILAHELGHLELPGGTGEGIPTAGTESQAEIIGSNSEGAAAVSEFIVSQQLNVPMHSDNPGVDNLLNLPNRLT